MAAQSGELFTAKHVARLRTVLQAEISPNGEHVAYLLQVQRPLFEEPDGPAWTELHVVDRGGVSRPYVSGKVNVSQIAWTHDGSGISFLSKRGDDKRRSLYVIPLHGGEARRVLTYSQDIQSYAWSPDGKRLAFTADEKAPGEKEKVRKKGFRQQIFEEEWQPTRVWIAHPHGDEPPEGAKVEAPRALDLEGSASTIHWSPKGDRIAVALAPTPSVDDAFMNRKVSIVSAENSELYGTINTPGKMGSFSWSPDGEHIALIVAQDRNDPREGRLVVAEASGGAYRDVLPDLPGHVTDVQWRDEDTVVYLADIGVTTALGEVRRDGSNRRERVEPQDGFVLAGLSLAGEANSLALLQESPTFPAEVAVLREDDPLPKRLTNSNPWLEGMRLAPQQVVDFKGHDGLRLQGVLVRPLDEDKGKRYPLILAVHGGPEAHVPNGWVTSYSNPGQVAAARGFAVFYPNYRASTGRGVEFSKLDHGEPAGKEFDDLIAAIDHFVAAGLADRARVGITGGSYGGYAAAWGATRYTERFAASVMFVGISDVISKDATTDIPEEIYLVHQRKRVWDDWSFFLERSPIYYVQQARTPILILHGKEDTRVHPSQSLELYRLLKMIGKTPVRLVLYPGEGHGNRRAASRYDFNLRLMRWMEHYLQGPGGEPPPDDIDYGFPEDEGKEKDTNGGTP